MPNMNILRYRKVRYLWGRLGEGGLLQAYTQMSSNALYNLETYNVTFSVYVLSILLYKYRSLAKLTSFKMCTRVSGQCPAVLTTLFLYDHLVWLRGLRFSNMW